MLFGPVYLEFAVEISEVRVEPHWYLPSGELPKFSLCRSGRLATEVREAERTRRDAEERARREEEERLQREAEAHGSGALEFFTSFGGVW